MTDKVKEYIASLDDEEIVKDTNELIKIMKKISGHEPQLWNVGTIGFDQYHYKYETGREGDGHILGFYPRKGKITFYIMDGIKRYEKNLSKLGKHSTAAYCLSIKRLSDIDITVLEKILQASYDHTKSVASKGPISQIFWQQAKEGK